MCSYFIRSEFLWLICKEKILYHYIIYLHYSNSVSDIVTVPSPSASSFDFSLSGTTISSAYVSVNPYK